MPEKKTEDTAAALRLYEERLKAARKRAQVRVCIEFELGPELATQFGVGPETHAVDCTMAYQEWVKVLAKQAARLTQLFERAAKEQGAAARTTQQTIDDLIQAGVPWGTTGFGGAEDDDEGAQA